LPRLDAGRLALPIELQDAVRRGLVAAMRDALARLPSRASLPSELPPELLHLASSWAGTGDQLAALAEAQMVAREILWDRVVATAEQVVDDPAVRWEVVKVALTWLGGYAGHMTQLLREAYQREITVLAGTRDDGRWSAVTRALDGHWVDASKLGYNPACNHLAVIVDTTDTAEALARQSQRDLLEIAAPNGTVWAWLGGPAPLSDHEIDALVAWQRQRDGEAAFGEPGHGIPGFGLSHAQAVATRDIARATGERVARFGDQRLLIALLRDRSAARAFVDHELAGLVGPGERMRELRATLRVYLEHGQRVSTTAALLRRDRKTVQRQLQSAEELLQRCIPDRSGELLIALRTADVLGPDRLVVANVAPMWGRPASL
jgi:hypothetical protein